MSQYEDLVRALRARILGGEWKISEKIPTIKSLQAEYGIRSLNTVRQAQQILVAEGLLETRHGIGAFVVSFEPVSDPVTELTCIRDHINTVLAVLAVGSPHALVVNVNDPDMPLAIEVLQEALQGYVGGSDRTAAVPPRGCIDTANQLLESVNSILSSPLLQRDSDLVERIRSLVLAAGKIGTADLAAKTVGITNVEQLFRLSRPAGIVIDNLGKWSVQSGGLDTKQPRSKS